MAAAYVGWAGFAQEGSCTGRHGFDFRNRTDTSGAVLTGVNVTLSNVDTGVTSSTKTGSEGQYTFSPIKIGHYSVSATASGFRTVHQNNVTVDVQQKVEVNLSLPVGQATEMVVVDAAPPLLQTLDASVGQVIEQSYQRLAAERPQFYVLGATLGWGNPGPAGLPWPR